MNAKTNAKRGQVALEMLIVTSFLLIILIPTLVYIFSVLSTESWKTDSQQAYATLTKIISVSNKLALLGEGSKSYETIYLPSTVSMLKVSSADDREIMIRLNFNQIGNIDVVAMSDIPITLDPNINWTAIRGSQIITLNVTENKIFISMPQ